MINGTHGVIWHKYYDEELLYTSYEREETEKDTKQWWMINGTYGVTWYKYYDKRNYYTPVMAGMKQREKNSGG